MSLAPDSKKTQGLRAGDIVRRQYFDGSNVIYSLMCVLSSGKEQVVDADTNEIAERSYFIGALLEGDAPESDQLLDFARVTSLFDTDRSGAMYLTGTDDGAPFMDVIDGIGREASLCWPSDIAGGSYTDPMRQYVIKGAEAFDADYSQNMEDRSRVLHLKRNDTLLYTFMGLQQDFYQFVENPNRVLVSFYAKSSEQMTAALSVGYQDGTRTDGEDTIKIGTGWQYHLCAVTIEYSGRHLRTAKLNLENMKENGELWIADMNIILLSSITGFTDGCKTRIGRLDGVNDPVFGTLNGYGGYLQKLFASGSAHVSGTLTAGDENGFAATFYAGKIHRNAFLNSTDIDFVTTVTVDRNMSNPTGIGHVYSFAGAVTLNAQRGKWLAEHVGQTYTLSCWLYTEIGCQLSISQNGKALGAMRITHAEARAWTRRSITFTLQPAKTEGDMMLLTLSPDFNVEYGGTQRIWMTAPQLEGGSMVTQYQPTDSVLSYTDDYGAWFSRGGIGGTIQNPLLQLNYDGEGSIGTRTKSLLLKTDGSGYLANSGIRWDREGNVTFGSNVTMTWDNLADSVQDKLINKSIYITGCDTFTLVGDIAGAEPMANPSSIVLTVEGNVEAASSQRQWYYLDGFEYVLMEGENGKKINIDPYASYWKKSNTVTVKCAVIATDGKEYVATYTVRKQFISGLTIEITSSNGETYKNNTCKTTLTANVFYQGKLVDPDYADENYVFKWSKYHLPDIHNPVTDWWQEQRDDEGNVTRPGIDTNARSITLDYIISGQDYYVCELLSSESFPYEFPLIF